VKSPSPTPSHHKNGVPTWRFGGAWTGVSPILVRIHTDEGLTGIGASQSTPSQQAINGPLQMVHPAQRPEQRGVEWAPALEHSAAQRALHRVHLRSTRLHTPAGPELGIEANEALVDEELIAAYAAG
jgi:L-alanine-DL-glutamate epimerase-like enolase superfamily enzyme